MFRKISIHLVFKKAPQVLARVLLVPGPLPEADHKVLPALEQALGLEGAQQPDVVVRGAEHQIDPDFTSRFSNPLQDGSSYFDTSKVPAIV